LKNKTFFTLLLSALLLTGIGFIMIFSTAPNLLGQQLISTVIGIIALLIGRRLPVKQAKNWTYPLLFFLLFFLFLPLIFGVGHRGAKRWLQIGTHSLQSSEILRPFFTLFCIFIVQKIKPQKSLKAYLPLTLCLLPPLAIFLQPNLGMTLLYLLTIFLVIILSGINLKPFLPLLLLGLLAVPLFWQFTVKDYQKNRIKSFLNPYADPQGSGYHLIQSQIAIGSGGFFGKGLGQGGQNQLLFLPERHNDFIFASFAEETGLLGILFLLALYLFLFRSLLQIGMAHEDKTLAIFSLVLLGQVWFQAFANIGMNLGLVPISGFTLPFVSYGGSSLISQFFSLGIANPHQNLEKDSGFFHRLAL